MKHPHTLLLQRLMDTPVEERKNWPDHWRGFWSGYMLGSANVYATWYDNTGDEREWQNGYVSGDNAWKIDNSHNPKPEDTI